MKIRSSRPLIGLALVSVLGASAMAQLQDGPPVDLKSFSKELERLKQVQQTNSKTLVSKVIQDFSNGAASNTNAVAFYQSALMATQNQSIADVQEMTKMEQIQNAARIHLNYLVLTIQHALGATTKQLEPALNNHIAAVMQAGANDGAIWIRREKAKHLIEQGNRAAAPNKGKIAADKEPMFCELPLITQPVTNSVFVQWYGIQKLVGGDKKSSKGSQGSEQGWEMAPGNIDGIYQNTLLPYYRQAKDPRAIAYWDKKIQEEGQKANASNSAFNIDQYNRIRRPQMLWNRAKDEIAIGLRNRGIAEMLEIVKASPDHPDLASWISELQSMTQTAPAAAASPAAQSASSTAAPDEQDRQ